MIGSRDNINKNTKLLIDTFFVKNSLRYSSNTEKAYRSALYSFFEFCPKEIETVKKKDVQRWQITLIEKGQKESTQLLKLYALSAFFSFLFHEGILKKNPIIKLEKPVLEENIPKSLDKKELFCLRDAARNHLRDRTMLETLYCTALRVSEFIAIELKHIDWDNRKIYIPKGKGSRERFVHFTIECKERMQMYLRTRNDNDPHLYVSRLGKPFTRQGIWKLLKKYAALAEINIDFSPHVLRHTWATHQFEKGAPQSFIATMLGHDNENSTSIYKNFSSKERKKNYEKYHR